MMGKFSLVSEQVTLSNPELGIQEWVKRFLTGEITYRRASRSPDSKTTHLLRFLCFGCLYRLCRHF